MREADIICGSKISQVGLHGAGHFVEQDHFDIFGVMFKCMLNNVGGPEHSHDEADVIFAPLFQGVGWHAFFIDGYE